MEIILNLKRKQITLSSYFDQIIYGSENLFLFEKLLEEHEEEFHGQILEIYCYILNNHLSATNAKSYARNVMFLDYLVMVKFPMLILEQIKTKSEDSRRWIISLCKICEVNKDIERFGNNVLPSYCERNWIFMIDRDGVPTLVKVLMDFKNDLKITHAILKVMVGIENMVSAKKKILYMMIKQDLMQYLCDLMIVSTKFVQGTIEATDKKLCNHFIHRTQASPKLSPAIAKLTPKDFWNVNKDKPTQDEKLYQLRNSESSGSHKKEELSTMRKEKEMFSFKQINNIKFRTGLKRKFKEIKSEPQEMFKHKVGQVLDDKKKVLKLKIEKPPTTKEVQTYLERSKNKINKCSIEAQTSTENSKNKMNKFPTDTVSTSNSLLKDESFNKPMDFRSKTKKASKLSMESYENYRKKVEIKNNAKYHVNILEYIIRLFSQIAYILKDKSKMVELFFPKLYQYLQKSPIYHNGPVKSFLKRVISNTSSIQYFLDSGYLPMLAVDLKNSKRNSSCLQCHFIKENNEQFLDKFSIFFNHTHQFGLLEVNNRMKRSVTNKEESKLKCILSVLHLIKCPIILNSILLVNNGIGDLLDSFLSANVSRKQYHAAGAIQALLTNLQEKFGDKCFLCHISWAAILKLKQFKGRDLKKKQIFMLTRNFKQCLKIKGESTICINKATSSLKTDNIVNLNKSPPTSRFDNSKSMIKYELECQVENAEKGDCKLILAGNEHLYLDREILASRNTVLEMMLTGSFVESTGKPIDLTSVDAPAMKLLLHFIYGCSCPIFFTQNVDSYMHLIYVAQMYQIVELQLIAVHLFLFSLPGHRLSYYLSHLLPTLDDFLMLHLFCGLLNSPQISTENLVDWISEVMKGDKQISLKISQTLRNVVKQALESISEVCNCQAVPNYM